MLWILTAALIVAGTAPAQAEPITLAITTFLAAYLPAIGPLALTGAGAGFAAGTWAIAQGLTTALLLGGLAGASLLLSPRRPGAQSIDPGKFRGTFKADDSSEINAIGRVRLGGVIIFGNTISDSRYRLIGHCKGPCDGIEETYLGGDEAIVNDDGLVTSNQFHELISLLSKIGDGSETAWDELLTQFPELWTVDHRVRGIAQTLAVYVSPGFTDPLFPKVYSQGEPRVEHVMRVLQPYDPRTDDNRWTQNGILCLLHLLLTWPELTVDDFDLDFIADEADRADALVDKREDAAGDDQEPRARCSGVWLSEAPRGDTLEQMLRSVGAEIVPRADDKLGIALIDDDREGEVDIVPRHIVDLLLRYGPEGVERPNLAQVKYYSPERGYEMAEIELQKFDAAGNYIGPAWARAEDEIAAVGEKPLMLEYPFCVSPAQAQRLARRDFLLARASAGVIQANWMGMAAWGARAIDLELPDELGASVARISPPRVDDARGQVEIPFALWPELPAWDPDTDEVDAPEPLPDLAASEPLPKPTTPSGGVVVTNSDGTFTRFLVEQLLSSQRTEGAYRTFNAQGNPNPWKPMTHVNPADSSDKVQIAYVDIDLSGEDVEMRSRKFSETGGRMSQWSDTFAVTPAVDNTAPADPEIEVNVVSGDNIVTAHAPDSLNVAYLKFTGASAPAGNRPVMPGQKIEWNAMAFAGPWTAQAFATDGTGSGVVST